MSQLLNQFRQARRELREIREELRIERRRSSMLNLFGKAMDHDSRYWRARWKAAQLELNEWRKYGAYLEAHSFTPPAPYVDMPEFPNETHQEPR